MVILERKKGVELKIKLKSLKSKIFEHFFTNAGKAKFLKKMIGMKMIGSTLARLSTLTIMQFIEPNSWRAFNSRRS